MNIIIVNLYGGPGSSKSTFAAAIFSHLKLRAINCELVTEYAKDVVWGENYNILKNQIYVFGKQHQRIFRLLDKVEVIITDSPLLMQLAYSGDHTPLNNLIIHEHNNLKRLDIFLIRKKPYNPSGRSQTLEEAKVIDGTIKNILTTYCPSHMEIEGLEENILVLTDIILKRLKLEKLS